MAGDPLADAAAVAAFGPGGWLAGIGTGLALLGIGAYRAMRGVKADSAGDKAAADMDARRKELDALMKEALTAVTKDRDEQRSRADGFAQERMKLASEVAGLTARLDAVTAEVAALKDERAVLRDRLKAVEAEMADLDRTLDALIEEGAITKAEIVASGNAHLLPKIQASLDRQLDVLGLRRVSRHPCAPADDMHDRSLAARTMRLSGNDAPLKGKSE